MIEIRPRQATATRRYYTCVVDNVVLSEEDVYVFGTGSTDVSATFTSAEAVKLARRQRFVEIPAEITRVTLAAEDVAPTGDLSLRAIVRRDKPSPHLSAEGIEPGLSFEIQCVFRVAHWKRPYSMGELRDSVRARLSALNPPGIAVDTGRLLGSTPNFSVAVAIVDPQATIGELLDSGAPLLRQVLHEAMADLESRMRADSLVALFDFPVSVRTACEQYLLYFADFLRTVGIEASADIRHDAGKVLFSVTPETGAQALETVRDALTEYLGLATATLDLTSFESDPRVQQLVSNIHHLRGQLSLASAIIQYKDATIETLERTGPSPKQLISGEILPASLQVLDSTISAPDEEEVIPGVVTVGKVTKSGVTVNLAEIFRRLRSKFKAIGPGSPPTSS